VDEWCSQRELYLERSLGSQRMAIDKSRSYPTIYHRIGEKDIYCVNQESQMDWALRQWSCMGSYVGETQVDDV